MKRLSPNTHELINFIGLSAMAVGMPLSAFLMSASTILLGVNWILERNFKEKLQLFTNNKIALVLTSLFGIHILGLIYTSDLSYAVNDIKIKLPLLVLPFMFSTMPTLSSKRFNLLLHIFAFAVFCGTMVSLGVHLGIVHTKKPQLDIRDISIFISHIRFSLFICLSIFLLFYYIANNKKLVFRLLYSVFIIWFIAFLILLESLTGIVILFSVSLVIICALALTTESKIKKIALVCGILGLLIIPAIYLNKLHKEFTYVEHINVNTLDKITLNGEAYTHDTISKKTENGYYTWHYIAWSELEKTWNLRSKIDYSEKDKNGNELRFTLIRFLTSKGLRKDAEGVYALSEVELTAIERGVANVYYMNLWSLKGRLHQTWWEFNEYKRSGEVNAHSSTQRIAYWTAALDIIRVNPILGVGTGDIKKSFDDYYEKTNSPLDKEHRLRAHNQYLTFTITFGLLGLVWFLFMLLYPAFKTNLFSNYFYTTFLLIALLSFMNEDTLETQAGVMFFAFFNSMYLFLKPKDV